MAFIRKSTKPQSGKIGAPALESGEKFTAAQMLELAKREGIETSPLDVYALVNALGIKLLCVPMDDEVSGSLSLSDNRKDWFIRVNALHHPNRQRFTVAHELGHFARHRSQQVKFEDQNFFRNGDSNAMEAEANRFAGELLMPESLFRDRVKLFGGSIEAIAKYFKVSTLAVRVQAKSLGMKGHGLE
jgi:Zn-dependent peptidase ImmA (M78 family)